MQPAGFEPSPIVWANCGRCQLGRKKLNFGREFLAYIICTTLATCAQIHWAHFFISSVRLLWRNPWCYISIITDFKVLNVPFCVFLHNRYYSSNRRCRSYVFPEGDFFIVILTDDLSHRLVPPEGSILSSSLTLHLVSLEKNTIKNKRCVPET